AATDLYLQAFASPLLLDSEQRVQAGRLLADCYGQRALWDMAGQTLDRCISLSPKDAGLRRSAAVAWRNAGTYDLASHQLDKLDDGSFEAALEMVRLSAVVAAAKSAEQADWSTVA